MDGGEGEADRPRLGVAEPVPAERLQLVSDPVTEVEGPRAAELEGITGGRDVIEVEPGALPHQRGGGVRVAGGEPRPMALQPLEERRVADQRDLDGPGHAGDGLPPGQRPQETGAV